MKRILQFLLPLMMVACSQADKAPLPFSKEMLMKQIFTVDADKDTTLETLHGVIIRIASGSFSVSGEIRLEIREAFTPAEILAAGLTTESNGRPLVSGGMIYINAVEQDVIIIKPIKVSVPNEFYDPQMEIFKGVQTDSGGINWTEPVKPDSTPQAANWALGKAIFRLNCASCHSIFKDITGPALMNVEDRGPWTNRNNIRAYIRNPAAYIYQGRSKYAQELKARYGSLMTAFPSLDDKSIDAILGYIKNESQRPGAGQDEQMFLDSLSKLKPVAPVDETEQVQDTADITGYIDPCRIDTVYVSPKKQQQSFFSGSDPLPTGNSQGDTVPKGPGKAESMEGLRKGFTDPNPTDGMYDFEIRTFGWYNVDAYVEGYAGTSNVKLWVQLQVEFDITMHVYLFCPRNKTLSVMNSSNNGKLYFDKINGGIPLFLNDRAILFAFGSKNDKIFYGISEFRVQGEQTIQVKVKESDEATIRKALFNKELEGIDLGIEKKEEKVIRRNCDDIMKTDSVTKK